MKVKRNSNNDFVVIDGTEDYVEQIPASATSRVLDGSSDHGYWMEYVGYGEIDGWPVRAVYLLDWDEEEVEEESDYDWDSALANGRIEVVVDDLDDEEYARLLEMAVDE